MTARLFLILLLALTAHATPPTLKPIKRIGPGWPLDKWAWMSFVAFNPDGTEIASDAAATPTDSSGTLTLWSFPEGKLLKQLPIQPRAISPDWKYVAGPHGLYEVATGKPILELGEKAWASFTFSPDSRFVIESSTFGPLHILDLPTGKELRTIGGPHGSMGIAISPDGKILATGHWQLVTLWDIASGKRIAVLRGASRYLDSLSFSPNGKILAGGTDNGSIILWDAHSHRSLRVIKNDGGYVSGAAFSPNGRLMAFGIYGTGTIFLYDVPGRKLLDKKKISDLGCGSVAISPNGRYLISPSTGGLITWPYDRGGTIRVFRLTY
jgi:WD40 repeat protein